MSKKYHSRGYYSLDENGNPVPEDDVITWAKKFQQSNRIVDQTLIGVKGVMVSTVFLGLDYSMSMDDSTEPILWETMVFDSENAGCDFKRYATREEAIKGHTEMVEYVKNNLKQYEN